MVCNIEIKIKLTWYQAAPKCTNIKWKRKNDNLEKYREQKKRYEKSAKHSTSGRAFWVVLGRTSKCESLLQRRERERGYSKGGVKITSETECISGDENHDYYGRNLERLRGGGGCQEGCVESQRVPSVLVPARSTSSSDRQQVSRLEWESLVLSGEVEM